MDEGGTKEKELGGELPELDHLVDKVVGGFKKVVATETDLSSILLKGHLFIENFIEELIAALDINESVPVHRLSFSEKLKRLKNFTQQKNEGYKAYIAQEIKKLIPVLSAINQIRNDLAHDYTFFLSEADVDKIGVNLGSKYILHKYTEGHDHVKVNLLFCLRTTIEEVGRMIYHRICDLEREEKNPGKQIGIKA